MKITKNTLLAYFGDIQKGSFMLFKDMDDAVKSTGISPRAIKNSITKRTTGKSGLAWDYAWNLIGEAKSMVSHGIETKEWFNEVFAGIENLDDIEEID